MEFGWGDKIAPRIGGAYDLLHNGKVKVYASYGQFYDIMKMGLARGSFGSDYWHNCVYAMDDRELHQDHPDATHRRRLPGQRSGARRQRRAASSRTWTSAPPRRIPAIRPSPPT